MLSKDQNHVEDIWYYHKDLICNFLNEDSQNKKVHDVS